MSKLATTGNLTLWTAEGEAEGLTPFSRHNLAIHATEVAAMIVRVIDIPTQLDLLLVPWRASTCPWHHRTRPDLAVPIGRNVLQEPQSAPPGASDLLWTIARAVWGAGIQITTPRGVSMEGSLSTATVLLALERDGQREYAEALKKQVRRMAISPKVSVARAHNRTKRLTLALLDDPAVTDSDVLRRCPQSIGGSRSHRRSLNGPGPG